MSEPEVKAIVTPEPPQPAVFSSVIASALENDMGLAHFMEVSLAGRVTGALTPDRWSWVYQHGDGFTVLPDRDESRTAYARICLEKNVIVAWEPLGG